MVLICSMFSPGVSVVSFLPLIASAHTRAYTRARVRARGVGGYTLTTLTGAKNYLQNDTLKRELRL